MATINEPIPPDFANTNRPKKVWAKWSYRTANLLVSMGYYFGSVPVLWNRKEDKMEIISSPFDKIRWICTLLLTSLIEVSIIFVFFHDLATADDMALFATKNPIRCGYTIISAFPLLFHFHTAWKYKEFVSFINKGARFYEDFQNKYAADSEWTSTTFEDALSGIIKFGFFLGTGFLTLLGVVYYLFSCNAYFLAPVLPICSINATGTWSYFLSLGLIAVQMSFCQVLAASCILYIDLFAAVVLVGHYMACEMVDYRNRKRRTTRLILEHDNWYLSYKSLQLIVLQLNDCIGEVFMPGHMLFMAILTSLTLFSTVEYSRKLGLLFGLFGVLVLILLGVYYIFLIGRGSSFSDELENALFLRKSTLTSKYLVRLHRSCAPIRPAVGIFFPLKGHTVGTMLSTSIEFAVDLMIMAGSYSF